MKYNNLAVPTAMLKIGEFAKLCGASVQTLRYYDEELTRYQRND